MALFHKKTKDTEEKEITNKPKLVPVTSPTKGAFPSEVVDVIIRPRVTEKATDKQQENVYIFEIDSKAGKHTVENAFSKIYKVKPLKINIVKNPGKNVIVRGKKGFKKGVKKAYIFLKEGDKIDIL